MPVLNFVTTSYETVVPSGKIPIGGYIYGYYVNLSVNNFVAEPSAFLAKILLLTFIVLPKIKLLATPSLLTADWIPTAYANKISMLD